MHLYFLFQALSECIETLCVISRFFCWKCFLHFWLSASFFLAMSVRRQIRLFLKVFAINFWLIFIPDFLFYWTIHPQIFYRKSLFHLVQEWFKCGWRRFEIKTEIFIFLVCPKIFFLFIYISVFVILGLGGQKIFQHFFFIIPLSLSLYLLSLSLFLLPPCLFLSFINNICHIFTWM